MRRILLPLLVLVAVLAMAGCGGDGGNGGSNLGRAKVSVTWPDRSRIIPDGADNIRLTITSVEVQAGNNNPLHTDEVDFARPPAGSPTTATHTFTGLPVGRYTATAFAYSGANPANVVATPTATATFDVTDGNTSNFAITLESVIASLTVSGTTSLQAGQTQTLSAAVQNASNASVMVLPANIIWRSNDPDVVFVNPSTNAVLGTETTGATATILATGTSGSSTVTASLRPNRESDTHFEDDVTVSITNQSFGSFAAVGASFGTQAFTGSAVTRVAQLVTNPGGFTLDVSHQAGTANPYVAVNRVGINAGNIQFADTAMGVSGSLDNTVADLAGVLAAGVDSEDNMFVLEQAYSVVGGNVTAGAVTVAKFNQSGPNWSQDGAGVAATAGSLAVYDDATNDEVYVLSTAGSLQRYATGALAPIGAATDLSSLLTGMVVANTTISVATDKKLYVAAPLTGGGSSKVVAIDTTGAPAAVALAETPTVPGDATAVAANSTHIFVVSNVGGVWKLTAFRRATGVFVAETVVSPTANPFVPYRLAAAAGKVYVLGAEITGGNTYNFKLFEVSLS